MMAYFLRAKSQLHCKMGPGFVHNFQEMTYLKPTFCEHCAGFVSLLSIIFFGGLVLVQALEKLENNTLARASFGLKISHDGFLQTKARSVRFAML